MFEKLKGIVSQNKLVAAIVAAVIMGFGVYFYNVEDTVVVIEEIFQEDVVEEDAGEEQASTTNDTDTDTTSVTENDIIPTSYPTVNVEPFSIELEATDNADLSVVGGATVDVDTNIVDGDFHTNQ